jgi:hypothetical protein
MTDKTLYAVGGFMRTGTSMMMKCLEAGGLRAAKRTSRDTMKDRFGDDEYNPNIGGLYELERRDYLKFDFPRGYEGMVLKALNHGIPKMEVMPNGIRCVFMRRPAEEIRQSYAAFFNRQIRNIANLDRNMESIIGRINNRKDVLSLHVFWYGEVVGDPEYHFALLQSSGWPIDVRKAASIVDPKYYRHRTAKLTIGVI